MKEIIKTSGPDEDGVSRGHCYDGTGWVECEFWNHDKHSSRCMLFGCGVEKEASMSLRICDKIYGIHYSGRA